MSPPGLDGLFDNSGMQKPYNYLMGGNLLSAFIAMGNRRPQRVAHAVSFRKTHFVLRLKRMNIRQGGNLKSDKPAGILCCNYCGLPMETVFNVQIEGVT